MCRLDLGTQLTDLDRAAQRIEPLPVDMGGERLAGDAALQPGGPILQDDKNCPASVADRTDCLVAGLAARAVEQQVDTAHTARGGGAEHGLAGL